MQSFRIILFLPHKATAMYKYLVIFGFCISNLMAQKGYYPTNSAIGAGMGNSLVAAAGADALFANVAGLGFLDRPNLSLYAERRFLLDALNGLGAAYALPTNSGTFLLKAQYYGFQPYNEQQLAVGYARKFLDRLSIGVQLQYQGFNVENFGSKSMLSFEAGIQYQVSSQLAIGVQVINPVQQRIATEDFLQTVFKAGVSWKPSKLLMINAEIEKSQLADLRFKGGLNYKLMDRFYIRTGIMTQPTVYCFGFGFIVTPKFQFDLAANYHLQLGLSPALGMNYRF